MMHTHSLSNRKPSVLSRRINFATVGAVAAAATLMFSPESAQAKDSKALKALKAELLAQGTDVVAAEPGELRTAIVNVLAANSSLSPSKLAALAAALAGEALKTPAALATSAGDEIAAAIDDAAVAADATARQALLGLAAKTASTGKLANAGQVDEFTATLLEDGDDVLAAALVARSSKSAVGAILGGAASALADDAARIALTNDALEVSKLAGAAQNIATGVGAVVADSDNYALQVSLSNPKLVTKIAPGVATADSDNAGEIVNVLLNVDPTSTDANTIALRKQIQKSIAGIAKSVSKAADIEQISLIGANIARVIGQDILGPNGKPLVSLGSTKSLATTLAKAIVSRPTVAGTLQSLENKADEVAEVAAYIVGGVIGVDAGFTAAKAPKVVLSIITAAIKGGKAKGASNKLNPSYIADIAGSVANTIAASGLDPAIITAIKAQLLNNKNLKKIGGVKADVIAAINHGFDFAGGTLLLENGTELGLIVEAETDNREFVVANL